MEGGGVKAAGVSKIRDGGRCHKTNGGTGKGEGGRGAKGGKYNRRKRE